MTITAKVIADSISEHSPRLNTLQLRYPKFIHGEFLTHRLFSRNSSSSRAIPVERLVKDVMEDPVIPSHWGANQRGMQADKECSELVHIGGMWFNMDGKLLADDTTNERAWLLARDNAVKIALSFANAGYHKQIVNRIIEPWCHINTVVTATEWSNFFALRRHPDAQPEMRALADAIFFAMSESRPRELNVDEWHTPYMDAASWKGSTEAIKLSVARCARVSYLTQEGKIPLADEDLKLYDRLMGQAPLHASPAEHQAKPDRPGPHKEEWQNPHLHGNIRGWCQWRKYLPGECQIK